MKLTIKTLQQSNFKIDIEPEKTVKELKEKIEADHGKDYPSCSQKLIYSGKILADESKLAEYNIDEKKFVVLMITRPPPVPKQTAASEKPTALIKEESKVKGSEDKTKQQQSSSSSSASTNTPSSTTTATTTPSSNITSSDPSRNTMPPTNQPPPNRSPAQNMRTMQQMSSQLASSLAMQSHFRQMQDLIQQRPHLLSSSIEALANTDPELYQFMTENPDTFVNALNFPPVPAGQQSQQGTTGRSTDQPPAAAAHQQGSVSRNPAAGSRPPAGAVEISVTDHDKQAIERLKELGFSEHLAIQAYMACDKDENLAANLLLQMDQ